MVREMIATWALPDSANWAVWAMFSATTSLAATAEVRCRLPRARVAAKP